MNIIGGIARGIPLKTPKGMLARPTGARSRKALFDSLANFTGTAVLDLFAGTGALGLEAASRGAENVVFVEKNPLHCSIIRQNIEKIAKSGVETRFSVVKCDYKAAARRLFPCDSSFDYIFADPPYAISWNVFEDFIQDATFAELGENATLIWEVPDKSGEWHSLSEIKTPLWNNLSYRDFGGTRFLIGR